MKAFLVLKDHDLGLADARPSDAEIVTRNLDLATVLADVTAQPGVAWDLYELEVAAIAGEFDDEYLRVVVEHLKQLEFRRSMLISGAPGQGGNGRDCPLRKPGGEGWRDRRDA